MCNHSYTVNNTQMPRSLGKRCPYPEIYEEARNRSEGDVSSMLPIDDQGVCIFHSRDVAWKRENDFKGKFIRLVQLLNTDETLDYYDFVEFRFVGNEFKPKPGSGHYFLRIENIPFRKKAYFTGAAFADALELDGLNFKDGATFGQAIFNHDLRVDNTCFRGVDFINAQLTHRALFSKTTFLNYALFQNTRFTGESSGYVVKFKDSLFQGINDFSGAVFTPFGAETAVGFIDVKFEDFTDFRNTLFHNQVVFSDVTFASITEFVDTLFDAAQSSARYRGAAVEFNRIEVTEGATLSFKSTDPQKKIFNHDVEMSFKEDPAGIIQFENVNFINLTLPSRDRLNRLAKLGRVEIGSGCIKYRLQTDVRTILIGQSNAPLVLEICQTFTNYFTVSNGFNLGFEIVERDQTKVSFFLLYR